MNFKKIISVTMALLLILSVFPMAIFATELQIWDGSVADGFSGGDGTKDAPYLISNGAELAYLRDQVNAGNSFAEKYIALSSDIALNDTSNIASWATTPPANLWSAIGIGGMLTGDIYPEDNIEYAYFCGNFDGAGHVISGVYMNNTQSYDYVSLFGCAYECSISNLTVNNSYFFGGNYIASIVGDLVYSEMTDCHSNATVAGVATSLHSYTDYIGGIGGCAYSSTVVNCSYSGEITAEGEYPSYIGGVFGEIGDDSIMKLCRNTANITATGTEAYCIGGVAGTVTGKVELCFNTGSVNIGADDINSIGGVVGYATSIIKDCYNAGAVTINAESYIYAVGGIVGNAWDMTENAIENCYNAGTFAATSPSASYVGAVVGDPYNDPVYCYYHENISCDIFTNSYGVSLSEDYMQDADSFTGFDFDNTWTFDFSTEYPYPELQNHTWNNGACGDCGKTCEHASRDSLGNCIYCGMACEHELSGGYCTKCGAECPHQFLDGLCGLCGKACTHYWHDSECLICALACTEHEWNANTSRCDVCGTRCMHPNAPEDFCEICGWDMSRTPIWNGDVAQGFASGDGTKENPFIISNGDELAYFAQRVNNGDCFNYEIEGENYISVPYYVALSCDIDLGDVPFTPIGDGSNYNSASFGGYFDGRGYKITGFVGQGQGLFGKTYGDSDDPECIVGRIENLSVHGYIEADSPSFDIGGIVGRAQGGVINNCSFSGYIKVTNAQFYYYGGIVGEMETGFVMDCTSDTDISVEGGHRGVGGVVGGAEYTPPTIIGCVNYGSIVATSYGKIGGIASVGTAVINCANHGDIRILDSSAGTWDPQVGGISGRAYTVTNCYNTGDMELSFAAGGGSISGIVSELNGDATVKNCYNAGKINMPEGHAVNVAAICTSYNDSCIYENVFSLTSDYPTYFTYNNDTYDYEPCFDGQISNEEMGSDEFITTLNSWVEQNPATGFTGDNDNVTTFYHSQWKKGAGYPALSFEPDVASENVLGDADGDGVITNSDITLYVRFLSGWETEGVISDMNEDGKINNRDVISLIVLVSQN